VTGAVHVALALVNGTRWMKSICSAPCAEQAAAMARARQQPDGAGAERSL